MNLSKNILKKKKVLYVIIGIVVVITGIIIWGAVTDWKFWNYSKNKYIMIYCNFMIQYEVVQGTLYDITV